MANKTFTYGGYTFEPRGTFKDNGIKPGKKGDAKLYKSLYYLNYGKVADGDEPFNYDDFYKAAGVKEDDVFYCKETGELYVPCQKPLCIFDTVSTAEEVELRYQKRLAKSKRDMREAKIAVLRNFERHSFNIVAKEVERMGGGLGKYWELDYKKEFSTELNQEVSKCAIMENGEPIYQTLPHDNVSQACTEIMTFIRGAETVIRIKGLY